MAAVWSEVKLFLTSHDSDFNTERQIFLTEILPTLRQWCLENRINLRFKDIRWGQHKADDELHSLLREIEESYYNNVHPVFVNLTCESLGVVPLWGDAPDRVVKEYQSKLTMTDLEMDLLYSAQRTDNINSMYVVREDSFLEALEGSIQFLPGDLVSQQSRQYGTSIVRQMPCERVLRHAYRSVSWSDEQDRFLVVLDPRLIISLTERVKECLQRDQTICDNPAINDFEQQEEGHIGFMRMRSAQVKGRADVLKTVEDYIVNGDKDVPLTILGGAGSGKTSIMAKCADVVRAKISSRQYAGVSGRPWRVFHHFVAAVAGSSNFYSLLSRFLHALDVVEESSIPRSTESCSQLTCSALCSQDTKPIVVFIDAINLVDEECAATSLGWLPRKLAPQVRVVLSLVNDCAQHKAMLERERKAQEVHLLPLDSVSRRALVFDAFSDSAYKLGEPQIRALLANRSSENPLWLTLACHRLKAFHAPTQYELMSYINQLSSGLLGLLEQALEEIGRSEDGHLVQATLCLIHVSAAGLLQCELLQLLTAEDLLPPSPFDEKEEKECSEKESRAKKNVISTISSLTQERWRHVLRRITPFLRPFGDPSEGKIAFYHRAVHKAIRRVYFLEGCENESSEEAADMYRFWHAKLADFFENCSNIDRKTEEYLFHLSELGDGDRLSHSLSEWVIFDKLFHEEYSSKLLKYWRQAGGIDVMADTYKRLLEELESQEPKDENQLSLRYEHIARILLQAGKYNLSLELAKVALKWEEKELGNRSHRIVDLYFLMSEIFDEKLKLNDFVSAAQIPDLRRTISYGRKSIELRKTLPGDYHQAKLGLSLMKLAFSLESWEACGGDPTLSGTEALREGNQHIDAALKIFKELKDVGHYAEALMTKGVLAPRGTTEQLKYYNDAMEICRQVYGEFSLLTSRLYINIGIVYEDQNDYVKAFEYFKKWAQVSEVVLGPVHPKTLRAKGVLKEPRYQLVALRLKEQLEGTPQNNDENSGSDESRDSSGSQINREVEALVEEHIFDVSRLVEQVGDIGEEGEERRDDVGDDENDTDMGQMNEELQMAINDLLRRALGQLDNRAAILQNLLNTLPPGGGAMIEEAAAEVESSSLPLPPTPPRPPGVRVSDNREVTVSDSREVMVSDNTETVEAITRVSVENGHHEHSLGDNRENRSESITSALWNDVRANNTSDSCNSQTRSDPCNSTDTRANGSTGNDLRNNAISIRTNDVENRTRVVGVSTESISPVPSTNPGEIQVLLNTASNNAINRSIRELSASFDNAAGLFSISESIQSTETIERDTNSADVQNVLRQTNVEENDEDQHEHRGGAWV